MNPFAREMTRPEFADAAWQERCAVTSVDQLRERMEDDPNGNLMRDVELGLARAPMAMRITPYVLSLIDWSNFLQDPIRKQFIPVGSEILPSHPLLRMDSLHEQESSPVDGLVHRYPDKALLLATDRCPAYCRFCTRSYSVGLDTQSVSKKRASPFQARWNAIVAYLRATPVIVDVAVSGGDCFQLNSSQLSAIGRGLLSIPSIRRIRFATKGLAVLPMKVTSDLEWTNALVNISDAGRNQGVDISLHTHFNHPREITHYTAAAAELLFKRGIRMRNQSVLMAGVNDDSEVMKGLVKKLSHLHIQPYYVFACDLVDGLEHMRCSLSLACQIEKAIRGITAGYNTPLFAVDTPGGGGKRDIHSFEYYNRQTGIAVYRAPSVRPDQLFIYPDPLQSLSPDAQTAWLDPQRAKRMLTDAVQAAQAKSATG
ncbi:KamA family radical SAM protein [Mesorhizobium sp. M8A.F.Ca.ET.165.01.1.1]|uniref:KamA family radical SAM protein n=1 Tax=Mesorhizobium sp. M8A.F.Ca.ET.165.01.1.1 TaxID=2563960 RepID=UPI0010937315|nr:KamA family radical SAM protein [Mesorhizobium sp. M8A.F.Ca.ET.165.01.1.1]TGT35773.1 KamA family radical SAM protein [Mesorhizobium sp. M8A.F.Ca.ET.165.01.1.1]